MSSTASTVSSFSKALALGEIHEDLVFPYPAGDETEAEKIRGLVGAFRDYAAEHVDSRKIDDERWIDDQVFRDLGELGLMGLYVPEEYGGAGPLPDGLRAGLRGASARPTARSPSPSGCISRSA